MPYYFDIVCFLLQTSDVDIAMRSTIFWMSKQHNIIGFKLMANVLKYLPLKRNSYSTNLRNLLDRGLHDISTTGEQEGDFMPVEDIN